MCVCVLHYETVPAVVRWIVSHDVQSTIMTWCLWCLMCCTGGCIGVHSQSPLPFIVPPEVSACPRLSDAVFSTGTASVSSLRNRTARCTTAWQLPPLPLCSNMPSRSGRNLQRKAEDSELYLFTGFFFICPSVSRISPKTHERISVKVWQISFWIWFWFNQNA